MFSGLYTTRHIQDVKHFLCKISRHLLTTLTVKKLHILFCSGVAVFFSRYTRF
uniref:Uncharacterized protein n=1 Tax=Arundo donax TaxID=35708 RepID=A0A0A9HHV9_ARUDO